MITIYQNIRSEEEVRKEVSEIREAAREISKDKGKAFSFLVDNGFITPDGKLAPRYGGK